MRSFIAICLALLMLLTAGCAKQAELVPESSVPGYFSQRQTLSGGSKMLRNVLLADVTAVREGEEVCLTLHFAQDGEPSRIPEYTVEPLMSPARLKVTLHAAAADVLALDLPPMGEFMGMVVETVEESAVVYLQFSGHVAYKLEENEESGTLTLRVRADDAVQLQQYHVKVPYRENSGLAGQFALTPALCDDFEHLCSLSAGFETIENADAQCKAINTALEEAGSDDTAEVIRLYSGQAPGYTEPVSRSMLTVMGAIKTDEGVLDGELIAMDARFLCWTDDGGMVMARPIVEEVDGADAITGEELWVYNLNTGRREQLSDAVFVSVQKAAFSSDWRYLAFVDQDEGARLMYLLDRRSGGLTFLSAEGMGDYTADFAWGTDGRLYAMCGEDSMQLMAYDPVVAQSDEDALTAMEEREGSYGSVGYADGKVFFGDRDGLLYALDAQTHERVQFEETSGFLLSPNGKKMLLIDVELMEDDTTVTTLRVRDMASGLTVQIASQTAISGYLWAQDGSALFYLTSNKGAQDAQDYPVRLQRYSVVTGVTEDLGALASNTIFRGQTQDDVIVLFYQDRGGVFYPITYKIDLTGGKMTEEDELIVTLE